MSALGQALQLATRQGQVGKLFWWGNPMLMQPCLSSRTQSTPVLCLHLRLLSDRGTVSPFLLDDTRQAPLVIHGLHADRT